MNISPETALKIARTGLWAIAALDVVITTGFVLAGPHNRNWYVLAGVYAAYAVSQFLMAFLGDIT